MAVRMGRCTPERTRCCIKTSDCGEIIAIKNLDITGKVCPYCLLVVQKQAKTMNPSDELVIICDHPPAATASIPQFAQDTGMKIDSKKIASGIWEIRITKK
jgi:TusA-related sulfurtransferase